MLKADHLDENTDTTGAAAGDPEGLMFRVEGIPEK